MNTSSIIVDYPDPVIRQDRINLVAYAFCDALERLFQNKLADFDTSINNYSIHKEYDEAFSIIEQKLKYTKESFLREFGVRNVFERARDHFFVPEYWWGYGDDHICEEYEKIYNKHFWELAENAVDEIARREAIIIRKSKSIQDSELNEFRVIQDSPLLYISPFSMSFLLKLPRIDSCGDIEKDDIGRPKRVNPFYAYKVFNAIFTKDEIKKAARLFRKEVLSYPPYSPYDDPYSRKEYLIERDNEINNLKNKLLDYGNRYPFIKTLYSVEGETIVGLLNEDDDLVSFLDGLFNYREDPTYSEPKATRLPDTSTYKHMRWCGLSSDLSISIYQKNQDCVIIGERVRLAGLYDQDGIIDPLYLSNTVITIVNILSSQFESLSIDDSDYNDAVIQLFGSRIYPNNDRFAQFLNLNGDSWTTIWNVFISTLKFVNVLHISDSYFHKLFILSRIARNERIPVIKVLRCLKTMLDCIVEAYNEGRDISSGKRLELIPSIFDQYLSLSETIFVNNFFFDFKETDESIKVFLRRYHIKRICGRDYNSCCSNIHPDVFLEGSDIIHTVNGVDDLGFRFSSFLREKLYDSAKHRDTGFEPNIEELYVYTGLDELGSIRFTIHLKNESTSVIVCEPEHQYFLFFDTETTGLPRYMNAPSSNTDNWPRLVQLSWILTDEKGTHLRIGDYIIKPEGYSIQVASSDIHGITTQKANNEGESLSEVIQAFLLDLKKATYIVGHNIRFDKKVIGAEMIRLGMHDLISEKSSICTMKEGTFYCAIPGKSGREFDYKPPTLFELHKKLFGVGFASSHNAASDVAATEKCFWELKRIGYLDHLFQHH